MKPFSFYCFDPVVLLISLADLTRDQANIYWSCSFIHTTTDTF